jgi:diketogulonate reductase-like aldo/keto reductase
MLKHNFGPTQRAVAAVGQGTWNLERASRKEAVAALRRGLDFGMTHIDTAEMYGAGESEDYVSEAIAGRRDEVFLVSKVLPGNASRNGTVKACEQSLKRLKTERLDCYLLHWRESIPLADTIAGLEDLAKAGKIRAWGVSNFDADDLEEALSIAGPGKIACNQVLYHLQQRAIEHAVLPWCETHGVALVGYTPFGSRFPGPATPGGRVLAEIGAAHGATPRQVALAFLVRRPALFAIPKASSTAHTEENAKAGSLALSDDELRRIDAAFPKGAAPRSLPMG